jgi:hypothetical protein
MLDDFPIPPSKLGDQQAQRPASLEINEPGELYGPAWRRSIFATSPVGSFRGVLIT